MIREKSGSPLDDDGYIAVARVDVPDGQEEARRLAASLRTMSALTAVE